MMLKARVRRLFLRASLIGSASALAFGVIANPAQALESCSYPYVCLYNMDGHRLGKFRDVTAGWQHLSLSRGATYGWNTRHDDVLYVRYSDGIVSCFPPNNQFIFSGLVTDIRISWSSVCRL